jgi:S-adenosylmethionine:tRNA ribosyltransferase-isomerase
VRTDDFDYALPEEQIARTPAVRRDDARLLVVHRADGGRRHARFSELPSLLRPADLLVVNDVRVAPARVHLRRAAGGAVEGLVLEARAARVRVLLNGRGRLKPGEVLTFAERPGASLLLTERAGEAWEAICQGDSPASVLERAGHMPIPPYIRRARREDGLDETAFEALDRERYQTVFARAGEAVAAPTAGLHFTDETLAAIRAEGVDIASLRLDVGPGTFAPIRSETLDEHALEAEGFEVPPETAAAIARARSRGGRVVAVGTTVVRALESAARAGGLVDAGSGLTRLFVKPGDRFAVVDALVTNFHLPKSSLLVLVSAFAGRELVLDAYCEAVREGYRFYSYGDATFFD